jgi:energy-coupling factor transporter transmembrane protein EcfT
MVMEMEPVTGTEKVVYREKIYQRPWLWVAIVGLVAIYVIVMIGAIAKHQRWLAVVFGIISVLILALIANFWRLVFIITENEVIFGFGLIKKRFKRSEIKSCELYSLEFSNYYGYGIRSGRDGTIAYNTRNGPGIKFVVEGRKKPYVVSVNDPRRICKLISPSG